MGALALSIRKRVTSELDTRARVTSELSTATRIANAKTASPPATTRVRMLVRWLAARGASSCGSGSRRSSDRNNGMGSSEEGSVDGPGVWYAGCGSPRGSSNAKAFEPRDAAMCRPLHGAHASLTNATQGSPPALKRRSIHTQRCRENLAHGHNLPDCSSFLKQTACAQTILLRAMLCRFRHSDALAGTWRPRKSWPNGWASILEG